MPIVLLNLMRPYLHPQVGAAFVGDHRLQLRRLRHDRPRPAQAGPHQVPGAATALFLVYALLILTGVGLSLGFVVDQAQTVPVTPLGLVVMALLAYTIFTVTVVLQRKAAARTLALGLATLALPAIPLALLGGGVPAALIAGALATVLLLGLRRPAVATWLDQP